MSVTENDLPKSPNDPDLELVDQTNDVNDHDESLNPEIVPGDE